METRFYKIQNKAEHFKVETPSSISVSWLTCHQSAESIITEVQSSDVNDFDKYETFYGERAEQIESLLLENPEEWEVLIDDTYDDEDEFAADKIQRRKDRLDEALQNLIPVNK